MFDSALLLDRPHASRLARAELVTLVAGAHAAALAALISAQLWRIDAVPPPNLAAPPLEPRIVVDFEPEPARVVEPPRSRAVTASPPAAAVAATRAATTPDQLAAAEMPSIASTDLAADTTASGAPSTLAGSGVGDTAGSAGGGDDVVDFEGSGLVRPTILVRVDPVYPPVARVQHRGGVVILRAEISADGLVRGAEVVQATPPGYGFEESALDAVRLWRFLPATTLGGRPVAVRYRLQVTFTVR